jgi:hypothetical protein
MKRGLQNFFAFKELIIMQSKTKVMLLVSIAALVLAMPLAAQNVAGSSFSLSSNQKTATATLFSTDVDNSMSYHNYSKVKFDKGFGFITGESNSANGPTTGLLNVGYASNFGDLYLGTWFKGNIFQNTAGNETVTLTPTYDNVDQTLTRTVETTEYAEKWLNSTNQIEFLIGVGGQGIKLGFFESLAYNGNKGAPGAGRAVTVDDTKDGRVQYSNVVDQYTIERGIMKPYIGWGTNIAVGDANLMPYIDLSLDMVSDKQVDNYLSYTEVNGAKVGETSTVGSGGNSGYLRPAGTVGAKIELAKKDTAQTTLELKYGLGMSLYNNSYEATGFSGDSVKGTVSWVDSYVDRTTTYLDRTETKTDITLTVNEITNISHAITPIYKIVGEPVSGFRLGFLCQVPVSFTSSSSNWYSDQYETTIKNYFDGTSESTSKTTHTNIYTLPPPVGTPNRPGNTEISNLSVGLDLRLGASYKLIPDRFTISAGITASPTKFTHTETRTLPKSVSTVTTIKEVDKYGNVTEDSVVGVAVTRSDILVADNTWAGYTGTLNGGFMFNFTPNAALDLGLTVGLNSFNVNIANVVNVLFSIKF